MSTKYIKQINLMGNLIKSPKEFMYLLDGIQSNLSVTSLDYEIDIDIVKREDLPEPNEEMLLD